MLIIDKNVPIPDVIAKGKGIYPFQEMEIGDSFAIEFENYDQARRKQISLCNSSSRIKRLYGKTFKTYIDYEKKEVRVWRIK